MNNQITPEELSEQAKQYFDPKPGLLIRLWLALLGLIAMMVIIFILFIPSFIIDLWKAVSLTKYGHSVYMDYLTEYLLVLIAAIYLAKDVKNGQGFTKRTLRFQVLNNSTGQIATPIQTVVRNLTCLIWPVEIIMMFVNPSRRIGDYLANTRLERYSVFTIPPRKYKYIQTLPAFLLALCICFICTIPLQSLFAPYFR